MLLTLGLLGVTVVALATLEMEWWLKLGIALGVQGARVGWLIWLARREGAGLSEADEQVW